MLARRRLIISVLCCGVVALGAGACQDDKPASGANKASPSVATPTTEAPATAETDKGSSDDKTDHGATSPEPRERTASKSSGDAGERNQASSAPTAAERKASAKAERLARSGGGVVDRPSTQSDQARDTESRDDWALYQERADKKQPRP
jgi:hypothetical protein